MKNIHILPTDKPSSLYYKGDNYKLANSTMAIDWYISSAGYEPTNIYITSSEEIKEGDWFLWQGFSGYWNLQKCERTKYEGKPTKHLNCAYKTQFKIILTTDQDLIADGIQAIDDEFLEWFVKNPTCEFVEIELDYTKSVMNYSYKIIIPQEEPKQETLEDTAKKFTENLYYKVGDADEFNGEPLAVYDAFIAGAKWQAQRMYSEEEVLTFLNAMISEIEIRKQNIISNSGKMEVHLLEGGCIAFESSQDVIKETFEQFKKK